MWAGAWDARQAVDAEDALRLHDRLAYMSPSVPEHNRSDILPPFVGTIGGEESLGVPRELTALHAPLPHPRPLVAKSRTPAP
jgi:hypothetical protein